MRWRFIKPRIDSKCRAQRRMQREQQAKLDNSLRLGSSERTYRGTRPRLDPREKDQLLYGYSRTPDLVVRTSEPEAAVASPQGTGMDVDESQLNGANHLEQLSENEAIVEISGSPVTVEWVKPLVMRYLKMNTTKLISGIPVNMRSLVDGIVFYTSAGAHRRR